MSTHIKRRTYRRLGMVVGTLGLLVIGTMLGVIGDEEAAVPGFVTGIAMVAFGGWAVVRSQRIGTRVSGGDRSDRMVGWYLLAVFFAGGSVFTAVSADTPLWLSGGLGLVTAGAAFAAVARTAPQDRDGSSPQTIVVVIGAIVALAVVRALDSGLALHLLVTLALGILVAALWRRVRRRSMGA